MKRDARIRLLGVVALVSTQGRAQAPAVAPKPIFVPGLYRTESRSSAFLRDDGASTACVTAADYDAFRRETIARYLKEPQFTKVCTLSDTKSTADGFAFAMDCDGARSIIAFHFAVNLVSSTTRTTVAARPDYSSTILTLSRRIGACGAREPAR